MIENAYHSKINSSPDSGKWSLIFGKMTGNSISCLKIAINVSEEGYQYFNTCNQFEWLTHEYRGAGTTFFGFIF